jgi:hypothetical protein
MPSPSTASALTHGDADDALEIASTALLAVDQLDAEHQRIYFDLVLAALPSALSAAVRNQMKPSGYEYRSDFARKYFGDGKAEGLVEGLQKALFAILSARGIVVTDGERARIVACADTARLDTMIARAATARSAAEILADG